MNVLHWLIPWEFSPTVIVVFAVSACLYLRGSLRRPPRWWRQLSFWLGMAILYTMLHTQWDYYAEREFFMHRLQHLGLHHMGPFLIMLAAPGTTLRSGLPLALRRHAWRPFVRSAPVQFLLEVMLHPVVASLLFFGLILLWLIPSIHFIAMIDWRWYRVMNWSMAVDGLFFWWLVLDRRPHPPARLSPGWRVMVPLLVAPPQLVIGAYIAFTHKDLYPIYDLCGRAFASISSLDSQQLGGLILWVPGGMMSALASLVALRNWLRLSARGRLPRRVPRGRAEKSIKSTEVVQAKY